MSKSFLPTTDQFPPSPQLTLISDGLAVVCFNKGSKRAEIGFLNQVDHMVYYSIVDLSTGKYEIECNTELPAKVDISSSTRDMGAAYYKKDAPENFDNLIDLTDIYGRNIDFKSKGKLSWRAKVTISDAVFSVEPKSLVRATPFRMHPGPSENDNDPPLKSLMIGRVLNAQTRSQDTVIKIGKQTIQLKKGRQYVMTIRTICPGTGGGDFPYYFDLLSNAGKYPVNLKFGQGQFPWLSERELAELSELSELLNHFVGDRKGKEADKISGKAADKIRKSIVEKIECLGPILKCEPAPCQKARMADVSRPLANWPITGPPKPKR